MPGGLPGGHRRAFLPRLHLGQQAGGGLRGHHRDQPVQLDLRAGMRCALRAGLPACEQRRPGADQEPQALRDGPARRELEAAAGARDARRNRGRGRLGTGRVDRRARPRGGRFRGARLRDDRPSRRHDGVGDPCLPAAAAHHPRRSRPPDGEVPRHPRAPQHRSRPRGVAGDAQEPTRCGAAHHRRVVGQADGHSGRGRSACRRRCRLPAPRERRRASRDARDGGRRRWWRCRHGCLPRGAASARLQAGEGRLPARPG